MPLSLFSVTILAALYEINPRRFAPAPLSPSMPILRMFLLHMLTGSAEDAEKYVGRAK
jgi:hypothetical protein